MLPVMARNFPRWTPDEYRQRPRDFDPGLTQQICDRVANGEALSEICDDRDMPLPATFLRWLRQDDTLASEYRQALLDRSDVLVEELLVVAGLSDSKEAKNQIDVRKFHAERLNPEKYAARSNVNLRTPNEPDAAGIDYGAQVRRKLAAMAANLKST